MFEQLCELEDAPIDLNTATEEDLQRLFFLSAKQREDLTEYLDRYRPLRSMDELALVESLDPLRKELTESFCYISEATEKRQFPTLKQIAKHLRCRRSRIIARKAVSKLWTSSLWFAAYSPWFAAKSTAYQES